MKKFDKLFYSGLGTVALFLGIGLIIFSALLVDYDEKKAIVPKEPQEVFRAPVQEVVQKPRPVEVIEPVKPKPHKRVVPIDTAKPIIVIDTTKHEEHT